MPGEIEYHLTDVEYADAKQYVNGILPRDVLEHAPEPQAVLQQVWSALKTGGTFVIVVPNVAVRGAPGPLVSAALAARGEPCAPAFRDRRLADDTGIIAVFTKTPLS